MVEAIRAGIYYEFKMLDYIKNRYGKGGTYIDIGAHLGTHSLFFAKECGAERVLAFEPQTELCVCHKANMRQNKATRVHLFNCGLGDEDKIMFARGAGYPLSESDKDEYLPVKIRTLKGVIPIMPTVKFIKIDTDGMEKQIIKSIDWLLERDRPAMAIECITGQDRDNMAELLKPYGYRDIACFNASPTYIWEI